MILTRPGNGINVNISWINLKMVVWKFSTDSANDDIRISQLMIIILEKVKEFLYHAWQKKGFLKTHHQILRIGFPRITRHVSETSWKVCKTKLTISRGSYNNI